MDAIITAISNFGFPIACCLICFWYINKKDETHKEEVEALKMSIDNNTLALNTILAKIGGDEN